LKRHINTKHNENAEVFECEVENCYYTSKYKNHLTRHVNTRHNENAEVFECEIEGCNYTSKYKTTLKRHINTKHNENAKVFKCEVENCYYTSKYKQHLKLHLMYVHNINVIWHHCENQLCNYKAKQKCNMRRHYQIMHSEKGIMNHRKKERAVETLLINNDINYKREHKITYNCINDIENKFSSVDFLIEHKDKKGNAGIIFLEVDEDQHKYWNYTVSCDVSRMTKIYESITIGGNTLPVLFIRYNPDSFKHNGKNMKLKRDEKQSKLINTIQNVEFSQPLSIIYINYD
ncbi:unnamed protein product, partial [Heterosigma akashiwo]